jgi:hypothetical protein
VITIVFSHKRETREKEREKIGKREKGKGKDRKKGIKGKEKGKCWKSPAPV